MKEIKICLGSSCYVKGAKEVLTHMQQWISDEALNGDVLLKGSFCMGHCQKGLTITIQEKPIHYITSENAVEKVVEALEEK